MTLLISIVTGYITGFIIGIKGIFDPMDDDEMFHDDVFFQIPGLEEEEETIMGDMPKRISMTTNVSLDDLSYMRVPVCGSRVYARLRETSLPLSSPIRMEATHRLPH